MARRDWIPVYLHVEGVHKHLARCWDCNPAWDIVAVFKETGEELSFSHANPEGEVVTKTRYAFRNRHIDRRFHIDYALSTKDNPRAMTPTVGDCEKEWGILIEHRDRYLRDAGLTLDSPAYEIANCLANTFKCDSYFGDKPMCESYSRSPRELIHPIDGLVFKSYCVGCAIAFGALAQSCGLYTRNLGVGAHWVAEVLIDGKWHFVENTGRHDRNKGLGALFDSSHMEMMFDPAGDHGAKTDIGDYRMSLFKRPNPQYHNFSQGSWQDPATVRFAADCANALYPDEDITIWALGDKRLPITQKAGGFYHSGMHRDYGMAMSEVRRKALPSLMYEFDAQANFRDYLYYAFKPGEMIRHSFWLDDNLSDLETVEVVVPFGASSESDFSDDAGAQLAFFCGDVETALPQLGAWPLDDPQNGLPLQAKIQIPVDQLKAGEVNWLYLQNSGESVYHMPFIPNAMQPYISPVAQAVS